MLTAPNSVLSSRWLAALKEMARVRNRPSISGSATCIARSADPRPRSDARQASTLDAGQHHLHDRRVEAVERGPVGSVETGGKRRRIEHDVKGAAIEKGAQAFERRFILEAGHKDARDREALIAEDRASNSIGARSAARYTER